MAGVQIDVSGVSGLKASLASVRDRIVAEVESEVAAEAEDVAQDARNHVRVDTGDLRNSIAARVDGMDATVAPRDELSDVGGQRLQIKANVNEFGRMGDSGQPFMVPAAEASRARWPKRAAEAVKRGADG